MFPPCMSAPFFYTMNRVCGVRQGGTLEAASYFNPITAKGLPIDE